MPERANSEIDICAQALILLAEAPIQSFDEGSDKATICENLYTTTIEGLFAGYTWRFAKKKAKLARLLATPINEWTYGFQLPSDRMGGPRAVFTSSAVGARPTSEFEIFGDKLYADATEIWIDYKFKPEVSKWPPHFVQLAVYAMAAVLADPLTDEQAKADRWQQIAFGTPTEGGTGGYYRTARTIDASEDPPAVIEDYSLIAVRG